MIEETEAEHSTTTDTGFSAYSSTPNAEEAQDESDDLFDDRTGGGGGGLYKNMNRLMNTIKTSASTFDIGRLAN